MGGRVSEKLVLNQDFGFAASNPRNFARGVLLVPCCAWQPLGGGADVQGLRFLGSGFCYLSRNPGKMKVNLGGYMGLIWGF